VLRRQEHLLYLDRYWREEEQVADDLRAMVSRRAVDTVDSKADIERLFPAGYEEQRGAAEIALSQRVTVLTGGPGTGKTTTVARLLALFAGQAVSGSRLRIALAAPTGKAAARLQEAVQLEIDKLELVDQRRLSGLQATTLHRLLGSRPDSSSRFRHHRGNRLPHDVIVVDETSMVSLTMMARLLEAVRPQSRCYWSGTISWPSVTGRCWPTWSTVRRRRGLAGGGPPDLPSFRRSMRWRRRSRRRCRQGHQCCGRWRHIEWVDDEDATAPLRKVLLPRALRATGRCAR
jgi:exodeoxyribonuclease V alpha subunit